MKRTLPTLAMLCMMLFAGTAVAQQELTLYNGNQQFDKVPFFAFWGDMTNGTKSQTIYPDSVLTALVGKKITHITYYNTGSDLSFTQNLVVKVGITNQHGYLSDDYSDAITQDLITMYQAPISITDHKMVIPLNNPWTYEGGNIVVSLHLQQGTCAPSSSSHLWIGAESNAYSSIYQYGPNNLSGTIDFFPKTTFTYIEGAGPGPGDIDPDDEPIDDILYVSASGVVKTHVPSYYISEDGKVFDFEEDAASNHLINWRGVDADNDGKNWYIRNWEGYGHNGSNGFAASYSYDNYYAQVLTPDNYLISDRIQITANNKKMTFFACAIDEDITGDKFGVGVSTTGEVGSFTMLQDWTTTAGGWKTYSVDLSNYVGQNIYVAIRHYNCTDKFGVAVDDIVFNDGNMSQLLSCSLTLDGTQVTSNLTDDVYLLDADNFAEGSSHTTNLVASYMSGSTIERSHTWTFHTPDHFQGSPSGLFLESDGNTNKLSWTLPQLTTPIPVNELYYNFADSTFGDLMLKDANNDGMNWRLYPLQGYPDGSDYLPYSFYNDGFARMCIRSDTWVNVQGEGVELRPDNYIYTPKITITENSKISFLAAYAYFGGTADSPEHVGVAVSDDGVNFTMVKDWWIDTHEYMTYHEYVADLSAYAGQQKHVAIRHYTDIDNAYFVQVDNIRISGIEATVKAKAIGAVVYCNGQPIKILNHGEQSFIHNVNRYESNYCIRIIQAGPKTGRYYALAEPQCVGAEMECLAPVNLSGEVTNGNSVISWERVISTDFSEDPEGWAFLDGDGDGYTFGVYNVGGMSSPGSQPDTQTENAALLSASAINSDEGAIELHPNNYAFMPLVKVLQNAKVTFYAAGLDPSYPAEQFAFTIAHPDGTNITDLERWTTTANYTEYTVDLSGYAGEQLFLGFHHFTQNSQFYLCIDNVTVTNCVYAGTESETDHYNIYRSTDGQSYQLIGQTNSDIETSYIDNTGDAGTFYYQVTAVNTIPGGETCESEPALAANNPSHNYVMLDTDGINEEKDGISIYPNPTKGMLNIAAKGMSRIAVVNTLGQTVYEANVSDDNTVIDMNRFGAGMYLLSITTNEGVTVRRVSVVK